MPDPFSFQELQSKPRSTPALPADDAQPAPPVNPSLPSPELSLRRAPKRGRVSGVMTYEEIKEDFPNMTREDFDVIFRHDEKKDDSTERVVAAIGTVIALPFVLIAAIIP
ncbi:MAG: hypothetical protein LBT53_05265 [Puniceicoccales bacterium]|nr:hypothetical protein [Puniceicoccales bacterium]